MRHSVRAAIDPVDPFANNMGWSIDFHHRQLAEGEISGHEVTCPWHGATFDIQTGEVLGSPAQRAVARYGVRVTGTDIEVEV